MLKAIVKVVVLFAIIFGALMFRHWQCEQMFPNAVTACMLWK